MIDVVIQIIYMTFLMATVLITAVRFFSTISAVLRAFSSLSLYIYNHLINFRLQHHLTARLTLSTLAQSVPSLIPSHPINSPSTTFFIASYTSSTLSPRFPNFTTARLVVMSDTPCRRIESVMLLFGERRRSSSEWRLCDRVLGCRVSEEDEREREETSGSAMSERGGGSVGAGPVEGKA